MRNFLFTILLCVGLCHVSSAQLDSYKYIVVPKKFQAFKNSNQYETSTLIKHLFSQQGFNAVYDDQLPPDAIGDRCLGLLVHLQDDSSMFATRTSLVLKDCRGQEVFVTAEGRSKEKEFKKGYNEAIREAFQSLRSISYNYTPEEQPKTEEAPKTVTTSFKNDVQQLEEPGKETSSTQGMTVEKEQLATPEVQSFEDKTPQPSAMVKNEPPAAEMTAPDADVSDVWYAQPIANGYQLVDSTPKIRLKLLKTSKPKVYLAVGGGGNGIVYQQDGAWFFEYYEGTQLKIEQLKIKF